MKTPWELKSNEQMKSIRQKAEEKLPVIIDEHQLEDTANLFKGLADETRLKIISLLWMEDLCMCEIVAALNGASSTISHHLKIMEKGCVIQSRKEGKFTIYSVDKVKLTTILPMLTKE